MNFYDEFKARGLIYQVSNEEAFKKLLEGKKGAFYIGFDPTATSLHVGNLLGIVFAKRLEKAGLKPIMLVGGATGLIGDPSGKSEERKLNTEKDVENMSKAIKKQLTQFFDFKKAAFTNNLDWTKKFSYIGFLRDVGKNFNIAEMIAKESVKSRMATGISYTEFSYMLMQGYDFVNLNKEYGAVLQIGGSDQWGNITAGIELIRKMNQKEALGATIPLVTDSTGRKLGKSAGNAIWLDAKLLSPYHFYQFWLNTDDVDVIKFLKYYTFISLDKINELEKKVKNEAGKREAQRELARAVTEFVHGKGAVTEAEKISKALFESDLKSLTKDEMSDLISGANPVVLSKFSNSNIIDFLVEVGISSSKRQAREDISNNAIEINGIKVNELNAEISSKDLLFSKYIIVKRGKRDYKFVVLK